MKNKRLVIWMLAVSTIFLFGGSLRGMAADKTVVGVAMPNTTEARWLRDGAAIANRLAAAGYTADLRNAENDVTKQIAQIEDMLAKGEQALIIAPTDDLALSGVLSQTTRTGTKVLAYDRLIRGTAQVDYFATFDNLAVGRLQAQSLLHGLNIPATAGPFNIELFAGSPNDSNTASFHDGAMSVLQPLIDDGTLVVHSGEASLNDIATLRWNADAAHARLDNLLSAFYDERHLDGVLAPNDEVASGIIASLLENGYGLKGRGAKSMPIITGQDCEISAIRAILTGLQYSSVFKDTRQLADVAVQMVVAALTGQPVPVNDANRYNNGLKVVPTYVLQPVIVDKDNVEQQLIRTGYYTRAEIN